MNENFEETEILGAFAEFYSCWRHFRELEKNSIEISEKFWQFSTKFYVNYERLKYYAKKFGKLGYLFFKKNY